MYHSWRLNEITGVHDRGRCSSNVPDRNWHGKTSRAPHSRRIGGLFSCTSSSIAKSRMTAKTCLIRPGLLRRQRIISMLRRLHQTRAIIPILTHLPKRSEAVDHITRPHYFYLFVGTGLWRSCMVSHVPSGCILASGYASSAIRLWKHGCGNIRHDL